MHRIVNAVTGEITEEAIDDVVNSPEVIEEDHREMRSVYLQITDSWALSDRTMTAEQTAYRQALRDVPNQSGWPNTVTWPTKPE